MSLKVAALHAEASSMHTAQKLTIPLSSQLRQAFNSTFYGVQRYSGHVDKEWRAVKGNLSLSASKGKGT